MSVCQKCLVGFILGIDKKVDFSIVDSTILATLFLKGEKDEIIYFFRFFSFSHLCI